jgi:hypothetical protein
MVLTSDRRAGSTGRSPRWPPTASSPMWCTGWAAWGLDLDRARSGRGDRGLAPVHRPSIGAYLGLVPTEDSSGDSRRQGSITQTGNGHARRLLVEAAWHHRKDLCHPRGGAAGPLGPGTGRGTGPRPRREPAAQPTMGGIHRAAEEAGNRQRRHRPRARRLVLAAGHPRVTAHHRISGRHQGSLSSRPRWAGRGWRTTRRTRALCPTLSAASNSRRSCIGRGLRCLKPRLGHQVLPTSGSDLDKHMKYASLIGQSRRGVSPRSLVVSTARSPHRGGPAR